MNYKDKKVIFIIAVVLLMVFVVIPIYSPKKEMLKRSSLPEILSKENVITFDEMNRFLETWSDFLTNKYNMDGKKKIDYEDENPKRVFPKSTIEWIESQGWEAKKFFKIEKRLRAIVKHAQRKKGADIIIKSLENQLSQTTDPEMARNIMAMIDEQNALYKDTKVSESEIRMVMPNLEIVRDILNGRAIYRPTR